MSRGSGSLACSSGGGRSWSRRLLPPAAALVIAVGTARPATADTVNVTIANLAFDPATATVQMTAGEPGFPEAHAHVMWTMDDSSTQHTVTFENIRLASSGPLSTGQRHDANFTFSGTFPYRCTIHPNETGTVVVTPPVAAPATSAVAPPRAEARDAPVDEQESGAEVAPFVIGGAVVAGTAGLVWIQVRRRRTGATGRARS